MHSGTDNVAHDPQEVHKFSTRTLRNYTVQIIPSEKHIELHVGRPLDEIHLEIEALTGGWPRRIGSELFALHDDEMYWISNTNQLVAWLTKQQIQLDWRSNSKGSYIKLSSKSELMAYLQRNAQAYSAAYDLPHYPKISSAFYTPKAVGIVPHENGAFFDLVDKFHPASDEDKFLIAAFFATPFWGCAPGSRPVFIIEGPEDDPHGGRGVGKSVLVDALAQLSCREGCGYIDVPTSKFDPDKLRQQIVNDTSPSRVIRYDNIKKARFSSEMLESLVTSPGVSGHKLYVGHAVKPNLFTYVLTFNEASMSKDMADRSVRIRLARPDYDSYANWKDDLFRFVQERRDDIIAEMLFLLALPGDQFPSKFRFTNWANDVLGKFTKGRDLSDHMGSNRADVDDEDDELEDIEDALLGRLLRIKEYDPHKDNAFIPAAVAVKWLSEDLGVRWTARFLGKRLRRGGDARLLWKRSRYGKGIHWVADREHPTSAYLCSNDPSSVFMQKTTMIIISAIEHSCA